MTITINLFGVTPEEEVKAARVAVDLSHALQDVIRKTPDVNITANTSGMNWHVEVKTEVEK